MTDKIIYVHSCAASEGSHRDASVSLQSVKLGESKDLELPVNEREKCLKYLWHKESFVSEIKPVLISIILNTASVSYTLM